MSKNLILGLVLVMGLVLVFGNLSYAREVLFSFEENTQGWEIPDWALEKDDHVGLDVTTSDNFASEDSKSLCLTADFPGGKWAGAATEIVEYFDWAPYQKISVDIYLPSDAPAGLRGKIVLTVGEDWKWTEMRRNIRLTPGEWTTITASIAPGSEDWRKTVVDENFRKDIRKLLIRVESNKPAYKGNIYIDNIVLE